MFILLLACTSKEAPPASSADSAPVVDSPADSGDTGAPPTGDALDDPIPLDATSVEDTIDPEGDIDYWSVELEEGGFLELRTVTVEGDPDDPDFDCDGTYDTNPLDTVIEVYAPDGTELIAADSWSWAACGSDTLVLVRAPSAGTYVVAVTDWNNWDEGGALFGNPPVGGAEYAYRLFTSAPEAAASTSEQALDDEPLVLLDGSEADVWQITVDSPAWLRIYHPSGTNAGFDDLVFQLETDGLVSSVDADAFYGTRWALGLIAPVEAGTWTVRAWDEDGADEADDWYWLWWELDEDSYQNPEIEPDDSLEVGTPLALLPGDGEYEGDYVQARFHGSIDAGDTDVFTAEVSDGDFLYLTVYVGQVGSPLDDAVSLVDTDGSTVLATADAENPWITSERASEDGTISVAITGADGDTSGYYLGYIEIWDSRRPW